MMSGSLADVLFALLAWTHLFPRCAIVISGFLVCCTGTTVFGISGCDLGLGGTLLLGDAIFGSARSFTGGPGLLYWCSFLFGLLDPERRDDSGVFGFPWISHICCWRTRLTVAAAPMTARLVWRHFRWQHRASSMTRMRAMTTPPRMMATIVTGRPVSLRDSGRVLTSTHWSRSTALVWVWLTRMVLTHTVYWESGSRSYKDRKKKMYSNCLLLSKSILKTSNLLRMVPKIHLIPWYVLKWL